MSTSRPVYIVDGSRTPYLKARGKPGKFKAADLALGAAKPLLLRQSFKPTSFDEVIAGCVMPGPDEANIARIVALRLGCGENMPAWTVQRNCASGMQALDSAYRAIESGRGDLILAGGIESMSHAPLLWQEPLVHWLAAWSKARSIPAKLGALKQLKLKQLAPVIALLRGLSDPVVGMSMGQTAEKLAWKFGITRQQMDEFAVASHQRLANAQNNGHLEEITPLFDSNGKLYESDDGLRTDSSVEKLAKLRAAFDRKFGQVTAGNSAQITDGAAWCILASEEAVKEHNLTPLGRIVDSQWAGVAPDEMGLGPVHASVPILQRNQKSIEDIDLWEINEAFAAQVLACVAALDDKQYCKDKFDVDTAFGKIDHDRLNVDGGAVSIGHPVGSTGTRIVYHLLKSLEKREKRFGIATLCIGGGQGGAMLIENLALKK